MTFDDGALMAYADGEGGALERKRVEQALATDPALAERVAAYNASAQRVRDAFAPIAQAPVPDRLAAMLTSNVVPLARPARQRSWFAALAVAAALVLGVGLGSRWNGGERGPVQSRNGTLVASGPLARALDTQLASVPGDVRVLLSFRGADGYCRVFASAAADGIACRAGKVWQLRQTRSGSSARAPDYRQASSVDAALLAEAQDMMVGAPLDAASEQRARLAGWR